MYHSCSFLRHFLTTQTLPIYYPFPRETLPFYYPFALEMGSAGTALVRTQGSADFRHRSSLLFA
jgi:hypothetical protein